MPRVLLIQDEAGIGMTMEDRFQSEGYEVEFATDGMAGFDRARRGGIDLIVLDLMLPKKSGMDVCKELRDAGVSTPVLMLTAKDHVTDRVRGLKTGADDYLPKPFEMAELLARVEAVLRRDQRSVARADIPRYRFGEVRVDPLRGGGRSCACRRWSTSCWSTSCGILGRL